MSVSDPEIKPDEWTISDVFPEEDEIDAMPATDADPAKYGEGD